ncbi:ATP-grasp domain-containing protein [Marinobacter changyiensis]|uniref:carboxylate--amine ligase n=1 Tax=Marinobacter changyiensis TaxID=2604091 RepID=UPI0012658F8E|nr:ATP-grasp domain-containing protein [Marinobacter changyiensis]
MDSNLLSVLVLDANQRSALAVTRSLGKSGQYLITTADTTVQALAGASRYSQAYLQHPEPGQTPREFIAWIKNLTNHQHFDLVMPTTEVTSQLLLFYRDELPNIELPFAPYKTVMALSDKISLVELAKSLGIDVPESRMFKNAAELEGVSLSYPCVLKPALSRIYTGEDWIHTHVKVIHDASGLQAALERAPYLQMSPFMLQSFIPGHGGGVFCLYNNGKPVQFFAHERLREKPPEGGVSVLCRSVPADQKLRATAQKLLGAVNWHGVAMVEFRITPEGKAYLMEVNTRFWGSLQLAVDSGVDFPLMLAKAQLGQPVDSTESYHTDQRLRWLLGDLDSLYLYLKGRQPWNKKIMRLISFLSIRLRHQKHEVNRLDDVMPAWLEFKEYIRALVK